MYDARRSQVIAGNVDAVVVDAGEGVDVATAGALEIGAATATAVEIGRAGITTTNKGALTVTEELTVTTGLSLSNLRQFTGVFGLPVEIFKKHDAVEANPPSAAVAGDHLGLITGSFLTSAPTAETEDLKAAGATSEKIRFQYRLPHNYVSGQNITLRLHAGMKTTVADTTATIDAQVVDQTVDPTTDVCATGATTINSLTAANKDFTLTGTTLVAGGVLDCIITIAVNDAATVTAVIGRLQIAKSALLIPVRG